MAKPLDKGDVRFFAGNSNRALSEAVAKGLGIPLEAAPIHRFSNDNMYIQLGASVRSRKVFIMQSLSPPVNDHLMELLMMIDIARGAAATEIHAIIPYFSFARSDKKDAPRISITAKLVAKLLETAGATHVMTMKLHSPQVHGFFDVPTDPLTARPVFHEHFRQRDLSETVVVSPDLGNAKAATRFASKLGMDVVSGNKERISDTEVEISINEQALKGYTNAIVYDDEIATGSSVVELCGALSKCGIDRITLACTHGVFTNNALEKLGALEDVKEIVTTDTVENSESAEHPKLTVLSVAPIFAEAISHNYYRESIGGLFTYWGHDDE